MSHPTEVKQSRAQQDKGGRRFNLFRLRFLLVAVVVVWAAYHYFAVQLPQYQSLKRQESSLSQQLHTLQTQHKQLQTQQAQLQDKTYILQYAAKEYNLILPGQVAFNISK